MPLTWLIRDARDPSSPARVDLAIVGCWVRDGELALCTPNGEQGSRLLELLAAADFGAALGEVVRMPSETPGARSLLVVGLGDAAALDATRVRQAAGAAGKACGAAATLRVKLCPSELVQPGVEGLLLGLYEPPAHRSGGPASPPVRTLVVSSLSDAVDRAAAVARAVTLARDLTNEPASIMTPVALASAAERVARTGHLACEIWDEQRIAAERLGGVAAVGAGSANPSRLIRLEYSPREPADTTVVLAGKGVTFDSGGVNLKTDLLELAQMKADMAGGAAVIAAMGALASLGIGCRVIALVPAVENLMGPAGMRPGDVIEHRGGTTTEIVNTDSEGRLILADALALASELEPDAIVDVATLTNPIALGPRLTALLANDDALAERVLEASRAAGEPTWRMPLHEPYRSALDSRIADIKNVGYPDGGGYLITSSLFLSAFVDPRIPWAHLDVIGSAYTAEAYDEHPAGATGAMVRTLLELLQAL